MRCLVFIEGNLEERWNVGHSVGRKVVERLLPHIVEAVVMREVNKIMEV